MGKEKYSIETKLAVVKYVVEGKHTRSETAERFGVPRYPIEKWVNLYLHHGEAGLKSRNRFDQKQGFTGEYKLNVLEYMAENHLSYTQTAAVFCLDVVTVSKWDKCYREKGAEALFRKGSKMAGKACSKKSSRGSLSSDMKSLEEENHRLRLENDYLKKLNALIQEKKKSATNKE